MAHRIGYGPAMRDNRGQAIAMAEIIDFAEALEERRRSRPPTHEDLVRAVEVLKASLAATAQALVEAPPAEQAELLNRIERLAAMVRYGLRMLGRSTDPGLDEPRRGESC
jgi:hypothetical protein